MTFPQHMSTAIGKFVAASQDVTDGFAQAIGQRDGPKIVYHYTDDDGFHGILESGLFWFSDGRAGARRRIAPSSEAPGGTVIVGGCFVVYGESNAGRAFHGYEP